VDRIGVIGIGWRAGAEILADFTRPREEREAMLPRLAEALGVREIFYLATCNRVEIGLAGDGRTPLQEYRPSAFRFLTGREPEPGEAERRLEVWAGEGAAEHLFLVAAGLDSAEVGETEVAGQFRDALKIARRAGMCGPRLEMVLEEALRVAARVHTVTRLGNGRVSLAEIALERVRPHLADSPGPVALVGVSPMTERCGRALAERGVPIVIVNRSLDGARRFAAEVGGESRSLSGFREDPDPVEAVVLATGASGAVLPRSTLEKLGARSPSGRPPLIIDLAIPPDVDPRDAAAAGLPRFGMDEVVEKAGASRERRLHELADARTLVDDALISLRKRMSDRMMGPIVAAIQKRYRETAEKGIDRLLRKELAGLGEAEREAVRKWMQTLARRFAHLPSEGLKGVAFETGLSGVEAFLARADESLASELEEIFADIAVPSPAKDPDS
jgi:glutamyl-tRNA reductase